MFVLVPCEILLHWEIRLTGSTVTSTTGIKSLTAWHCTLENQVDQISVILKGWEQPCPMHESSNASRRWMAQGTMTSINISSSLCHCVPPSGPCGKPIPASQTLLETERKARRPEPWLLGVSHEIKTCLSGGVHQNWNVCLHWKGLHHYASKWAIQSFDGLAANNRRIWFYHSWVSD